MQHARSVVYLSRVTRTYAVYESLGEAPQTMIAYVRRDSLPNDLPDVLVCEVRGPEPRDSV